MARPAHRHDPGALEAPMPGRVAAVNVSAGQRVAKGEELLVVEAMKMENALRAPQGRRRARGARLGRGHGRARAGAGGARVSLPAPGHGRRGRAARRPAERGGAAVRRRPGRLLRAADRGRAARRRGGGLRLAEVGPADGGLGRGPAPRLEAGPGVRLPVLVPNRTGFDRARAAGAREIAVFTAASETFNRRNTNASIDESFARFAEFVPEARREGLRVRGYVSTVLRLPVRGHGRRRSGWSTVARRLVRRRLRRGVDRRYDRRRGADTGGGACSGGCAARSRRIAWPRTSTTRAAPRSPTCSPRSRRASPSSTARPAGLGGCPYAPGAAGNLATEDLALHARRDGDRDRRRPRGGGRGVARARRAARPGAALPLPPGRRRSSRAGGPPVSEAGHDPRRRRPAGEPRPHDAPARALRVPRPLRGQRAGGARRCCGAAPVDLVLLDIMMPGMTGLDVLQDRARRALTAAAAGHHGDREDGQRGRRRGALARRQRLRDEAGRLPGGPRAHPERTCGSAQTAQEAAPAVEPRSPAQAVPGTVLGGRYRLEPPIGGGSFGTVFRARHLELDRDVAVKVLATSAGTDPEALARFRREGASACRVQHPNAVAVLDFGVNRGRRRLPRDGAPRRATRSRRRSRTQTQLTPRRCAEIVVPVCAALAAAHAAGVVHRDVKPSNVFLHRTPQGEVPKILDFGIAKIVGEAAARPEPHRRRLAPRHAGLHGARALPPRPVRPEVGRLQRRRDALRDALGPAALHPRLGRPAGARGDAGGGGPAAAAALPGHPPRRGARAPALAETSSARPAADGSRGTCRRPWPTRSTPSVARGWPSRWPNPLHASRASGASEASDEASRALGRARWRRRCGPARVAWCDGSRGGERAPRRGHARRRHAAAPRPAAAPGSYLHRSHPSDVARTEHLTFIASRTRGGRRPDEQLDVARGGAPAGVAAVRRRDEGADAVRRPVRHGPARLALQPGRRRGHGQPVRGRATCAS